MTEKRFTVPLKYSLSHSKIQCDGEPLTNNELVRILNTNDGAFLENFNLKKENRELKNDEKQLSIDFLGYKMKLKKILQKRYAYADEQCQKNLNNPIIYKVYDMIRYDVKKLAEEMGVDLK